MTPVAYMADSYCALFCSCCSCREGSAASPSQAGWVTYTYLDDFATAAKQLTASNDHRYRPKFKQWIVYSMCLRDYGARHRWMGRRAWSWQAVAACTTCNLLASAAMLACLPPLLHTCHVHVSSSHHSILFLSTSVPPAFIDSDEFMVLTDATPSLPALLADYEDKAGLVLNWRILGSSARGLCWRCGMNGCMSWQHCNRPLRTCAVGRAQRVALHALAFCSTGRLAFDKARCLTRLPSTPAPLQAGTRRGKTVRCWPTRAAISGTCVSSWQPSRSSTQRSLCSRPRRTTLSFTAAAMRVCGAGLPVS